MDPVAHQRHQPIRCLATATLSRKQSQECAITTVGHIALWAATDVPPHHTGFFRSKLLIQIFP